MHCLFPCWPMDKRPGGHLLHLQKLEQRGMKGALMVQGWHSPQHWNRRLYGKDLGEKQCHPSGDGDAELSQAETELCSVGAWQYLAVLRRDEQGEIRWEHPCFELWEVDRNVHRQVGG